MTANDDDPEVRETADLGRIESRRLGPVRAHRILLGAVVIILVSVAAMTLFARH